MQMADSAEQARQMTEIHPVDRHLGQRLRHRRWILGMTQQQLGRRLGIQPQQVQKYETGANRISASRLWDIAAALDADISFFFDGLGAPDDRAAGAPEESTSDREALVLLRTYRTIPAARRKLLLEFVRVLAEAAEKPGEASTGMARTGR